MYLRSVLPRSATEVEHATRNHVPLDLGEPQLDLVQPMTNKGRREVKPHSHIQGAGTTPACRNRRELALISFPGAGRRLASRRALGYLSAVEPSRAAARFPDDWFAAANRLGIDALRKITAGPVHSGF